MLSGRFVRVGLVAVATLLVWAGTAAPLTQIAPLSEKSLQKIAYSSAKSIGENWFRGFPEGVVKTIPWMALSLEEFVRDPSPYNLSHPGAIFNRKLLQYGPYFPPIPYHTPYDCLKEHGLCVQLFAECVGARAIETALSRYPDERLSILPRAFFPPLLQKHVYEYHIDTRELSSSEVTALLEVHQLESFAAGKFLLEYREKRTGREMGIPPFRLHPSDCLEQAVELLVTHHVAAGVIHAIPAEFFVRFERCFETGLQRDWDLLAVYIGDLMHADSVSSLSLSESSGEQLIREHLIVAAHILAACVVKSYANHMSKKAQAILEAIHSEELLITVIEGLVEKREEMEMIRKQEINYYRRQPEQSNFRLLN